MVSGAAWAVGLLLAFFAGLMLVLMPIDLILGVGHKHDTAFGFATLIYTAAVAGAFVAWFEQ